MNKAKILKWVKYLLPLFLALILWLLTYINSFVREPSGFTWYAVVWILATFYLQWKCFAILNKNLNKRIGWDKLYKRLLYQFILTIISGVLLFEFTFLILNWVDNNWMGSNNPLSITHLIAIAVYGFIFTCLVAMLQFGIMLIRNWKKFILTKEQISLPNVQDIAKDLKDNRVETIQRLIVKKGIKSHVLLINDIAYFEKDELVFAITHTNERFIIDHSLKELMDLISNQLFFRISRQHIVNIDAIKEWAVLKNNLIIGLNQLPNIKLKVSQRNISSFKTWASELEVQTN